MREIIFVIVTINVIPFLPRYCFKSHAGGFEKKLRLSHTVRQLDALAVRVR